MAYLECCILSGTDPGLKFKKRHFSKGQNDNAQLKNNKIKLKVKSELY